MQYPAFALSSSQVIVGVIWSFCISVQNLPQLHIHTLILHLLLFLCIFVIVIKGSNEPMEVFVGEVTSYTLHNLNPSTTYDVNVYAQYDSGLSVELQSQVRNSQFS